MARSEPADPLLSWPGRGRAVVRDPGSGRWRFGERAGRPPALRTIAEHGARSPRPNLVVHGEAMDAMGALLPAHEEGIRLVYIDPPFNTGQEFARYDDRAAHAVWLSALEERARRARELLCPGGFFVAHINVVEQAYLKVLLDEVFGRDRLVAQIAWQRAPDRTLLGQGSALIADQVEYLLCYAKGAVPRGWPRPQRTSPLPPKTLATYGRTLEPSAAARLVDCFRDRAGQEVRIYAHASHRIARAPEISGMNVHSAYVNGMNVHSALEQAVFNKLFRLTNQQEESTFQRALLERMAKKDVLYRAEFTQPRGKHAGPRARHYLNGQVVLWLKDVARLEDGRLSRACDLNNFWTADEIPATGIAGEGGVSLRRGKKPERLLERVVSAFSRPGDWVIDFFAGSGTTGAVAERLGRRWILVEAGAAARELAEPRLVRLGAAFTVADLGI